MTSLALGIAIAALLCSSGLAVALYLSHRARRRPALEGRLVLVNTPKPDDQTLRGLCTRELEGGGVVLAAAFYVDRVPARGGGEEATETAAGDVVVPRISWAQIITPTVGA